MIQQEIRFDDGAAYERFMGVWSRLAGDIFLDWLAPPPGLTWLDVGCGNGAFTDHLIGRAKARSVLGIDPSEGQLEYARKRHRSKRATFEKGDAQELPAADASFDAAVMALVIVFVKAPAKGVAEMVRAVKPGGSVSAYMWDLMSDGFPLHFIGDELETMGAPRVAPPSPEVSRLDRLQALWTEAGLQAVDTQVIEVERVFADFDELWDASLGSPRLTAQLASLPADQRDEMRDTLRERVRAKVAASADGRITCQARAHAVRGRVPG